MLQAFITDRDMTAIEVESWYQETLVFIRLSIEAIPIFDRCGSVLVSPCAKEGPGEEEEEMGV